MRTETEAMRHRWLIVALLLIATLMAAAKWAVLHLPPHTLEDAHRG
ncbi:MAG TPA: hypothetical protein VK533_14930 [Sphingomonas sp.]|nr:hypothetical protein [Sphingomonas sp.]HMI20828.1 hypothetical protein [Sphingomonas sp.]